MPELMSGAGHVRGKSDRLSDFSAVEHGPCRLYAGSQKSVRCGHTEKSLCGREIIQLFCL